jgi:hypothetical protein
MVKLKNFALLICIIVMSACGSSGAGSTPTSPSQSSTPSSVSAPSASIQKAVNTVLSGVTASINGTKSGSKQSIVKDLFTGGPFLAEPQSLTQQCNASGTSCSVQFNESFSQPTNCLGGGSSNVSSTLTGVIQGSPSTLSGTLNMSARSTFADCTENGWVTNSNPSIGISGTVFLSGQHMRINLTVSGGFLITNAPGTPNGRSSCFFNGVLLQWDDITGNWANSGSVDCTPGGSFRFSS